MKILVENHNEKKIENRKNLNNFTKTFLGSYTNIESETITPMVLISLNKIGFQVTGNSNVEKDIEILNQFYNISKNHNKKILINPLWSSGFILTHNYSQTIKLHIYGPFTFEYIMDISHLINKQSLECFDVIRNSASLILNKINKT